MKSSNCRQEIGFHVVVLVKSWGKAALCTFVYTRHCELQIVTQTNVFLLNLERSELS